ncbi:hypothetical protein EJ357_22695 [Streptomyces cyaneochromogenes]|uniref:Uncharacterized protein n=1 Tax=Streptomyces cyaneochromogenes TaxID=2496836 RepID=A0A3Q9EP17_9ACTN|nr:hypothetical protein [Streptomyces cyaneochromogenes]AZQ35942.1 hypothetical protein EJ357_22695 [Streptomyces cyaneochromogenes]
MLDPKLIANVDEATALGIAALWNDAIELVRHMLDHQVDDIDDGIRQALECDRDDCQTHDVRHREGDDTCPCWACANGGLLYMARDLRDWLDDLEAGAPIYRKPSSADRLLSLVTDWLHVNDRVPRTSVPNYHLGAVYRLLAELADQTKAIYAEFSEVTP